MRIAILLAALLFASLVPMAYAHYPHDEDCPTTEQLGVVPKCLQEARQAGREVKLVNIFFSEGADDMGGSQNTNIPTKIEVAPGDGRTKLVAVMSNSGSFVLTGTKGWLSLPIGFNAVGRPVGEPAFDSYDLAVPVGGVFVFEFPVEVTENTRVGIYKAILHVEYFKAHDISLNTRTFDVEFLLPGKSVLDARAVTPVLLPSTGNNAKIEIVNDGSAPASGVIASIDMNTNMENNQIVNIGKKVFDIGVIRPQSKVTIDPTLYVNPSLINTRQNVIVDLSYFDAYGQRKTTSMPVNFLVAGTTTESIDFTVTTDKPIIHTITETPFTITLYNTGIETARSVEVTVNTPLTATVALSQQVPEASRSPISIIGGDGYTRINEIRPGESTDVQVVMFASQEAVNTSFQLPVTISYLDQSGGMKQIQRQVSVYVQGTISLRVHDFGITYIVNEPNVSGFLLNEGTNMALFTTVELVDNPTSVKQIGGPQYLGDLTANSPLPFNIPVRFTEGAGIYPVKLKVSYKDDLRIPFEVEIDGSVSYTPILIERDSTPDVYSNIGIIVGVAAVGVAIYLYLWKRRQGRKKARTDSMEDDLDFLSESKQ